MMMTDSCFWIFALLVKSVVSYYNRAQQQEYDQIAVLRCRTIDYSVCVKYW